MTGWSFPEAHRPAGLRAVPLTTADVPILQRFFAANPGYFLEVNGEPPRENEAQAELHERPPADWSFSDVRHVGFAGGDGELAAMASLATDLPAPGIWHVGLFIVETARHGQGDAVAIWRWIERWATDGGAQWMRLGVVLGNARAERFWQKVGFVETRRREGVAMGRRTNTIRVMVKPLHDGTVAQYLARVARDRPGAP